MLESLGKRIRRVRKQKRWTQATLAQAIGVKTGTLSGYERDYRRPDVLMLDRIASILGVSVDYLLGRADNPTSDDPSGERADASQYDPLVGLAIEAIPELSPEGRLAVERFLEYCRESDRLRRDKVSQHIRKSE